GVFGTQCAFDVARDRVIVLPSHTYEDAALDTLPVITFAAGAAQWTRMPIDWDAPTSRAGGTVIIDPVHDRLILQGGAVSNTNGGGHARDLWTLSLGGTPRWRLEIFSQLAGFEQAAFCGLAVDPTLDRIMLVGGEGLVPNQPGKHNPVESTGFDDPESWSDLDPGHQSPMSGAGPLFFDAAADRMLWWNGRQLWEITWLFGTPSPYGPALVSADAG